MITVCTINVQNLKTDGKICAAFVVIQVIDGTIAMETLWVVCKVLSSSFDYLRGGIYCKASAEVLKHQGGVCGATFHHLRFKGLIKHKNKKNEEREQSAFISKDDNSGVCQSLVSFQEQSGHCVCICRTPERPQEEQEDVAEGECLDATFSTDTEQKRIVFRI